MDGTVFELSGKNDTDVPALSLSLTGCVGVGARGKGYEVLIGAFFLVTAKQTVCGST
jgi:hypothetical protein